jgi:hypothetical protein
MCTATAVAAHAILQAAKSLRSLAVGIAPDAANIMTNQLFHHNQCCCFLLRPRSWGARTPSLPRGNFKELFFNEKQLYSQFSEQNLDGGAKYFNLIGNTRRFFSGFHRCQKNWLIILDGNVFWI